MVLRRDLKRLIESEQIDYPLLTADNWSEILLPWLLEPEGKLQSIFRRHGPASRRRQEVILRDSIGRIEFILKKLPIEKLEQIFAGIVYNECVQSEQDKMVTGDEVKRIAQLIARIVQKP